MRIKRGTTTHRKHSSVRKATKGMTHSRRRSYRMGKQGIVRSLQYSYRDRRTKKRTFRQTWNTRINAAARENGTTYSKLINSLKASDIKLDRKVLADIAVNDPKVFTEIIKNAK